MTDRFCVHCGQAYDGSGHAECRNPRTALEPPRYCPQCARRMVVQVTPSGWQARCSRHGEATSADAPAPG
ncbi:hypothetical protein B0I33_104363 [Prauserella shujinwangii]|uniref:Biotin synthase auxiliary protein n=1 Tax=Prauserella shujinwangii TaxID=1453103 RepID=A0A2T0LWZ6_9PSEU|nr:hypothetical protein [Prauserella shujinwangii]PRX48546.1 hypothetical protein B0I33_104363 [Prauserella shujinwangii]